MTTNVTEIAPRASTDVSAAEEWSVERIVGQALKIQECMKAVMRRDEHYGVIPGTGTKPTLLKPGAEKLCLMFRLCPEYEILRSDHAAGLIAYTVRCTLAHIPTGSRVATGLGSCNSRENKYIRPAPRKCAKCGAEALIQGKPEFEKDPAYRGGLMCYQKKGGCGAKYKPGDEIERQPTGVADPADLDNTLLKMACKRALVAAVLNGTAASDCFTQDLEDLAEKAAEYTPPAEDVQRGPTGAPIGGNVPVPNRNGRGSWPKPVTEHPADVGMREMDEQFRRSVGAPAKSDLEAQLAKSVADNQIEVVDHKTGEVTVETKATAAQIKKIHAMCREMDIDDKARKEGMLKYYKVDSVTLLTKAQAIDMIERLEKTRSTAADILDDRRGDEPDPSEMERIPGEDDV